MPIGKKRSGGNPLFIIANRKREVARALADSPLTEAESTALNKAAREEFEAMIPKEYELALQVYRTQLAKTSCTTLGVAGCQQDLKFTPTLGKGNVQSPLTIEDVTQQRDAVGIPTKEEINNTDAFTITKERAALYKFRGAMIL